MSDKKNKTVSLLSLLTKPFYDYYKYFTLNKVLGVKGISKEGVHIFGQPKDKEILYVIKLITNNNYFEKLEIKDLKTALRHSADSQFYYYFIKNKNFQAGYISTFSKEVANAIADKTNLPILNIDGTLQFLLDIYKSTEYYPNKSALTIDPTVSSKKFDKKKIIDPMQYNFSTILKEGASNINEKYKLFQVVQYTNKRDFNYLRNFRKDFDGIMEMSIDLSDAGTNYLINKSIRYANVLDREKAEEFKNLQNLSKAGKLNTAAINTIILSTNTREANNTAGSFGFELIEKQMEKINIISKSLMLTREMDYDALVPVDYLNNIIGIRTKKSLTSADMQSLSADKAWVDIKIDFSGIDLFDAPTNFCFRANENPHAVLIADAGTGKSVAIQKIIKTILRYDIENSKIGRFKNVKVRYFEIGGSSAKLLNAIKKLYPTDIGIINGVKEALRFSITDIIVEGESDLNPLAKIEYPKLDANSLSTAILLASVILEETGESALTASEEGILVSVLRELYREKKYKYKTLKELEKISNVAYEDFISEALSLGYNMSTKVNEIEGVSGVSKLQKPTILDVMAAVRRRSNSSDMNVVDKGLHDTLYKKLQGISATKESIFSGLSSLDFNNKQFYSFEFNQIKEDQALLRAVFTFLFSLVYRKDIDYAVEMKNSGGVMPQVIYIFEESKNFFYGNESITRMMEKTVFEGRKFQIHAIFIAQQTNHIPRNIIDGCSTFMFLMPESKEKRVALSASIEDIFPKQNTVRYLMENIPFRVLGIISSQGVSSCKLELTQTELEMFAN